MVTITRQPKALKILKVSVINKAQETIRISKSEIQVIKLMSEGMTSKAMAGVLFLSPDSIDTVRLRVIRKLRVSNSCECVAFAIRTGIIQ